MKFALASLLLLPALLLGCRKPVPAPPPPAARVEVAFLDQPVTVAINPSEPAGEGWFLMNAGAWEPLTVAWSAGPRGRARVERTAPDWVSLQSPRGQVYRTEVRTPASPRRTRDLEDDEYAVTLGLLFLLSWVRP